RILYDKRFSAFHYPVTDEDAPNYHTIITNPMDMATLLQRVDSGKYITCKSFLEDFDLILSNAKKYNGDDYNGARIVSRACELRDAVHGMLTQMDPTLVAYCDKIADEGGPVPLLDDAQMMPGPAQQQPQSPVLTRASARLRNVNVDEELTKSEKKHPDGARPGTYSTTSPEEEGGVDLSPVDPSAGANLSPVGPSANADLPPPPPVDSSAEKDESAGGMDRLKQAFVARTAGYGIPEMERLYTRVMKAVFDVKRRQTGRKEDLKAASIMKLLFGFAEDESRW
ncbi:hypothetical protein M569_10731, partial [Genlisea aurea]